MKKKKKNYFDNNIGLHCYNLLAPGLLLPPLSTYWAEIDIKLLKKSYFFGQERYILTK